VIQRHIEDGDTAPFAELAVGDKRYRYASLAAAARVFGLAELTALPFTLRILAENLLRRDFAADPITAIARLKALTRREHDLEIPFYPARVLLQDLLGIPVMVDFAGLRTAIAQAGGDPERVNPHIPVDFVVDHSIIADAAGCADAAKRNSAIQYARNRERFEFLAWCQSTFRNFRVVPPDSGIVHQINVEQLARVVWTNASEAALTAYPDTMLCNDSHATMANGIGVLGWGVGGIEAEAAMLGRPLMVRVPEIVGIEVTGALPSAVTATDLVLTIAEQLRKLGVVGKFVEFHGAGLDRLSVADRVTIANMAPEFGATCVFFPVDQRCVDYLGFTARAGSDIDLVKAYTRAQGLWRDATTPAPHFDTRVTIALDAIERCLAGPRRPHERVPLGSVASRFLAEMPSLAHDGRTAPSARVAIDAGGNTLGDGDIVIAAITSCTNTSNPTNMVMAGLIARNAHAHGLSVPAFVKTSFAPGSRVVMDYLERAGLRAPLEALGFHLVGFGCTTCNGNSGPLHPEIERAVETHGLVSVAVISGNRNFEGRVHPRARAAYLASPPLVIAYAIAGTITRDLTTEPLGNDSAGRPVYLRDIWPSSDEVAQVLTSSHTSELYRSRYRDLFTGPPQWQTLRRAPSTLFPWSSTSTFIRMPPFFDGLPAAPQAPAPLTGMRALAILGDTITTDHLSPNNTIGSKSVAAKYLTERGVAPADFQTYGFRRGNHEMALRGTFASGRLKNEMVQGREGPYTILQPDGIEIPIFDAAEVYRTRGVPLLVIAGREYGAGSSRDWAAKGPALLGVRVVVAESFERIHRSNLVGMGVLPVALDGPRRADLKLNGTETFDVVAHGDDIVPGAKLRLTIRRTDGTSTDVPVVCRIDTTEELNYYRHGGLLPAVYRDLLASLPSRGAP
jgi:aconitate hydratase